MKIRTITYGIPGSLAAPAQAKKEVDRASRTLNEAVELFGEGGWEVQTTRLSLTPVLNELPRTRRKGWLGDFAGYCQEAGLEFVSLGAYLGGELTVEETVAAIQTHPSFNLTTIIAQEGHVLPEGVREAAAVIQTLAGATPDGLLNFRYAAIAHCPPGIPFFPASYQAARPVEPASLALGLQMPDLALEVVRNLAPEIRSQGPAVISEGLAAVMVNELSPLQALAE